MTKHSLVCAIAFFFVSLDLALAQTGGHVGNGGDRLRELFASARVEAASILGAVDECSFNPDLSSGKVFKWLLQNRAKLKEDILRSPHRWNQNDAATCAWTQPTPAATIDLSFKACRAGNITINEAAKILIHESVHHLGFTDEEFPTAVAAMAGSVKISETCDQIPKELSAFDDATCSTGKMLKSEDFFNSTLAGSPFASLGNYEKVKRLYELGLRKNFPEFSDFKSLGQWVEIRGLEMGIHQSKELVKVSFLRDNRDKGPTGKVYLALSLVCNNHFPMMVDCGEINGETLTCPAFTPGKECPQVSSKLFQFKATVTASCVSLKSIESVDTSGISRTNGAIFWWQ